jgi:hypothetical protein
MTRASAVLVLLLGAAPAFAQQDTIPWLTEPQQAVNEAKRSLRPLMVYVLASNKYRDDKLDHLQKAALEDPRVVRLSRQFVPLRLSRSINRDVLGSFGLSESANMEMSFVTPDGQVLGNISAGGVAQPSSLAEKLTLVLRAYTKKVYENEVKPVLGDTEAKPPALKRAVQLVGYFRLTAADQGLIELLDRPRLDRTLRGEVYDTLAALSTKTAIDKLFELAVAEDSRAAKALEKCTPLGAEHLLDQLSADDFNYGVYKTVTQACDIRNVKSAKFFENAKPRLKQEEVDRVTKLVREAAQRWRQQNDEAG